MQALRRLDLSRQLQVLAAILVGGIIGLMVQQLHRTRADLLADTERQLSRLDMVFAEQTGRALETVDLILRGAGEAFARNSPTAAARSEEFDAALARRNAGVRQAIGLGIVNAEGQFIDASEAWLKDMSLPAETKSPIQEAIRNPSSAPAISDPFKLSSGAWTAALVRPVPATGSGTRNAAVALLDLSYFEDFYRSVELTENGAILLHKRDGTVLARYPHDDRVIGQSYAHLPPFTRILSKQQAGTLRMDSPLDGSRRVIAIRALKLFPVAIGVSVSERQVLDLWRREALVLGIISVAAASLVCALLLTLSRRSREAETLVCSLRAAKDSAEEAHRRITAEMDERERVEKALRQVQRSEAIGRLTGGVAHDFNNLLAVVMGNIDLLELAYGKDAKTLGRLAVMRAAVERGATLTSQLLAFSRRQPLLPRPTDLNELVAGVRNLLQSALGSRIKLQIRAHDSLGPVMIDKAQIELVVLNLAINARDAMPGGGSLTIETGHIRLDHAARAEEPPPGEYAVLTVHDTGCGMAPDVAAKAFEPFFTTKDVGKGSGLGLSQVYGTARQLGGGARIDSEPGRGTAVHVYVPLARVAAAPASAPARPRTARAAKPARVLVVDDDPAVRATTTAVLAELGYSVLEASGGADALAILERREVDLLLTDVVMPSMTGPELARRARERFRRLAVVFISGYADPDSLAGEDGLVHLVRKPFRPEEIVAAIEQSLGSVPVA